MIGVPHCGYCGKPLQAMIPASGCTCSRTPAQAPAAPAPPVPSRTDAIEYRYGVAYCTICNFAAEYCKGHAPADARGGR